MAAESDDSLSQSLSQYQPTANSVDIPGGSNFLPPRGSAISMCPAGEPAATRKVRDKLIERLKMPEDKMSQFHPRWQANERRFMAVYQPDLTLIKLAARHY